MGRFILCAVLAAGFALPAGGSVSAATVAERPVRQASFFRGVTPPSPQYVAGQSTAAHLLVKFSADADAATRADAIAAIGATVDGGIDTLGVTRVVLADGDDVAAAIGTLAAQRGVTSVERDGVMRLSFAPNDQYYLTDPWVHLGQWGLRKASVDKAWDLVRGGSPSVVVATIDSGVDPNHPDLAGALLPGVAFVTAPSPGCAAGAVNDDNGHGTHVAGIIAANGNNGIGVAGIAYGVKILPMKALDCKGAGLYSDVARAITTATDRGARIINISLGSTGDSGILHDAVRYASDHGALVVAAAGNCGIPGDCLTTNAPEYPAAYPEVLAVGASDPNDQRASFSTQQSYVAVVAPGQSIVSSVPTYATTLTLQLGSQGYASLSGTSQASPFVTGLAALLLSENPSLTLAQLRARIVASADSLGQDVPNIAIGSGRVNALSAVKPILRYGASYDTSSVPRSAAAGSSFSANVRVGNTSGFTWDAGGALPVHASYHWTDPTGASVTWEGARTSLVADLPPNQTAPLTMTVAAPLLPGQYRLRVDMVLEGVSWFSAQGVATTEVAVSVTSGFGATYAPVAGSPSTFAASAPGSMSVALTNTGLRPWSAAGLNPVHLSYHLIAADGTVAVWDGLRANLPSDLAPGASVTVPLTLLPPSTLGAYTLRLDLVQEGLSWFSGLGVPPRDVAINVTSGYSAQYTVTGTPPTLLPGGRVTAPVTLRNDGIVAWSALGATPVHLATHIYDASGNTVVWDGERTVLAADVPVNGSVNLSAAIAAPLVPGTYRVRLDLVREGVGWFSTDGARTADVTVTVVSDLRASLPTGPLTVSRTSPQTQVAVTNLGVATWTATGAAPIALASHWLDAAGHVLLWDGPRASIGRDVAPGASLTLTLPLAPPPPGATTLVIDLVADGLQWFGAGSPRAVTLVP